jgi:hypothetical protein
METLFHDGQKLTFGVPRPFGIVKFPMLGRRQKHQILGSIVPEVSVDVMNVFDAGQVPSDDLHHHESAFMDVPQLQVKGSRSIFVRHPASFRLRDLHSERIAVGMLFPVFASGVGHLLPLFRRFGNPSEMLSRRTTIYPKGYATVANCAATATNLIRDRLKRSTFAVFFSEPCFIHNNILPQEVGLVT